MYCQQSMYCQLKDYKETTIKILDGYIQVEDSNSMRFFPIGKITLNSILGMISGGESVTINL